MDCIVNTVLANVLARELVAVLDWGTKRHSKVHVVDVLFVPGSHVSNESVQKVAFWHILGTVLVERKEFFHHQESHVLIADVHDEGRSTLVDFLWQLGFHHLKQYFRRTTYYLRDRKRG
jgi:hypothetical protein